MALCTDLVTSERNNESYLQTSPGRPGNRLLLVLVLVRCRRLCCQKPLSSFASHLPLLQENRTIKARSVRKELRTLRQRSVSNFPNPDVDPKRKFWNLQSKREGRKGVPARLFSLVSRDRSTARGSEARTKGSEERIKHKIGVNLKEKRRAI